MTNGMDEKTTNLTKRKRRKPLINLSKECRAIIHTQKWMNLKGKEGKWNCNKFIPLVSISKIVQIPSPTTLPSFIHSFIHSFLPHSLPPSLPPSLLFGPECPPTPIIRIPPKACQTMHPKRRDKNNNKSNNLNNYFDGVPSGSLQPYVHPPPNPIPCIVWPYTWQTKCPKSSILLFFLALPMNPTPLPPLPHPMHPKRMHPLRYLVPYFVVPSH